MPSVFSVVALALLAGVQHVSAVCSPGQMAIGFTTFSKDGSEGPITTGFGGFEMTNDCGFISTTATSSDPDQYCNGKYSGGAAVLCGQDGFPTIAVDTSGNSWQCNETSDTSCNSADPFATSQVLVCCDKLPAD